MSQTDNTPSLGARGNWWGNDDTEVDSPSGHSELQGISKEKYVAGNILRQSGDPTILCPLCLQEFGSESPLSEPEHYVPRSLIQQEDGYEIEAYADHRRHRHCRNPDCGHISWGGILQDRPAGDFLDIVQDVLSMVKNSSAFEDIRESEVENIYERAVSLKAKSDFSDEQIMERVVFEIEHPSSN